MLNMYSTIQYAIIKLKCNRHPSSGIGKDGQLHIMPSCILEQGHWITIPSRTQCPLLPYNHTVHKQVNAALKIIVLERIEAQRNTVGYSIFRT
jgi:hypothetical protein